MNLLNYRGNFKVKANPGAFLQVNLKEIYGKWNCYIILTSCFLNYVVQLSEVIMNPISMSPRGVFKVNFDDVIHNTILSSIFSQFQVAMKLEAKFLNIYFNCCLL